MTFPQPTTVTVVAAAGAVLVVVSTLLPWFTFGPIDVNAWDVPLNYLFTGKATTNDGIKVGLPLMIPAIAALPVVIRWALPQLLAFGLGGIALIAAAFGLLRTVQGPQPHPGLGFGVFVAAAGGVMIVASGWMAARASGSS